MADYTVNKSDGTIIAIVTDGTVDSTSSSIRFVGREIIDYGEIIAENQFHIMENFANTASPSAPSRGQLWWDTSINILNIFDGSSFLPLALEENKNTLNTFTVATLPIGALGQMIFVSDESGGSVLAFFDGINWRRSTDRAIVS